MLQQNKLQTMIKYYCKQKSTWKQSHPPDPPDSVSPPQRTLRQISGDITFQEYLKVFVLVYQRFLLGLKLYFQKSELGFLLNMQKSKQPFLLDYDIHHLFNLEPQLFPNLFNLSLS